MALKFGILTISGVTAITLEDSIEVLLCETTDYPTTITLPASPIDGTFFYIKDIGGASANNIIIDGNSKLIEGATSITISTNYEYVELLYSSDLDMWFDL